MTRRGFSLIEIMIYATILTIVCTLVMQWFVLMHGIAQRYTQRSVQLIALHAAHDLFVRDIYGALGNDAFWHYLDDIVVFRTAAGDIGWSIDKGKLVRTAGRYNYTNTQWIKSTKSIVAGNVSHLVVQPDIKKALVTAQLVGSVGDSTHEVPLVVFLRNHEGCFT